MAEEKGEKAVSVVKYQAGNQTVTLSFDIVRNYLCKDASDQEIYMFMMLCKYQGLNPFLREAYLVKYGTQPASIVVGKDTFTKRAAAHEQCAGWESGVIVTNKDGHLEERIGKLVLKGETLEGGWAVVYRKDWQKPLKVTVSLAEYLRRDKEGNPTRSWREMPATMIAKVALVQALRDAFPDILGGMYAPEEMPVEVSTLPDDHVVLDTTPGQAPAPATNGKKQDDYTWFWSEVRALCKCSATDAPKRLRELTGVQSVKGYTRQQLEELVGQVKDKLAAQG